MNKILTDDENKAEEALIVIPDECGDSMWDKVLGQEIKACNVPGSAHSITLLKEITKIPEAGLINKEVK